MGCPPSVRSFSCPPFFGPGDLSSQFRCYRLSSWDLAFPQIVTHVFLSYLACNREQHFRLTPWLREEKHVRHQNVRLGQTKWWNFFATVLFEIMTIRKSPLNSGLSSLNFILRDKAKPNSKLCALRIVLLLSIHLSCTVPYCMSHLLWLGICILPYNTKVSYAVHMH